MCKICAFSPKKPYQKAEIFTYLEDPGILNVSENRGTPKMDGL